MYSNTKVEIEHFKIIIIESERMRCMEVTHSGDPRQRISIKRTEKKRIFFLTKSLNEQDKWKDIEHRQAISKCQMVQKWEKIDKEKEQQKKK